MKILVINGPNLNMLGIREPDIYGHETYESLISKITEYCAVRGIEVLIYQSNHEGDLVDKIQSCYKTVDAIIINPAAYTHTSIAIRDALKAVQVRTVEVHLSCVDERESFRRVNFIRDVCEKTISGHGINGYLEAVDYLVGGHAQ